MFEPGNRPMAESLASASLKHPLKADSLSRATGHRPRHWRVFLFFIVEGRIRH